MDKLQTKIDVINHIARERWVEGIINNVAGNIDDTLKDLSQEIYIDLLSKDDEKIVEMFNSNQLKFFVTRMITNQVFSKNSPYYCTWKKNITKEENIDDYTDKI